jgi:hypothetical protein
MDNGAKYVPLVDGSRNATASSSGKCMLGCTAQCLRSDPVMPANRKKGWRVRCVFTNMQLECAKEQGGGCAKEKPSGG